MLVYKFSEEWRGRMRVFAKRSFIAQKVGFGETLEATLFVNLRIDTVNLKGIRRATGFQ